MGARPIVVGVKGWKPSGALVFAMEEAALRRCPLHVITVVHELNYGLSGVTGLVPPRMDDFMEEAEKALQKEVDEFAAAHRDVAASVPITAEVKAGHAGQVLCAASQGAAMLVVGRHSHEMIASLGSVTLYCVLHAPCPVMVVR
jgi:nucleotide-binding universal stress UspA family protein